MSYDLLLFSLKIEFQNYSLLELGQATIVPKGLAGKKFLSHSLLAIYLNHLLILVQHFNEFYSFLIPIAHPHLRILYVELIYIIPCNILAVYIIRDLEGPLNFNIRICSMLFEEDRSVALLHLSVNVSFIWGNVVSLRLLA